MSSPDALRKDASVMSAELRNLRQQLQEAGRKKEGAFQERAQHARAIVDLIARLRTLKKQRDSATATVKQLKEKRSALSGGIRSKIDVARAARSQIPAAKRGSSHGSVSAQLARLEQKVETEALSPEKEKQLMSKIKQLRRERDNMRAVHASRQQVSGISHEIDVLRTEADTVHAAVQEAARDSQAHHEELLSVSKRLDELRTMQAPLEEAFRQAREEFARLHALVNEKSAQLGGVTAQLDEHKKVRAAEKQAQVMQSLAEREQAVEEKLKTKKKLTTEDLLVFQGRKEE